MLNSCSRTRIDAIRAPASRGAAARRGSARRSVMVRPCAIGDPRITALQHQRGIEQCPAAHWARSSRTLRQPGCDAGARAAHLPLPPAAAGALQHEARAASRRRRASATRPTRCAPPGPMAGPAGPPPHRGACDSRSSRRRPASRSRLSIRPPARPATSRAAATSSAAAVGVGARTSATKSAIVKSVFMTDAADHRHRAAHDHPRQRLVIEGPQVLDRPAATHQQDDVDDEAAPAVRSAANTAGDTPSRTAALRAPAPYCAGALRALHRRRRHHHRHMGHAPLQVP